jgi:serine/threonine-protein kinase HipA
MPRARTHPPLLVLINNRLVGRLSKQPGGAIEFGYDPDWLAWTYTMPLSLSLPLREARYTGAPVAAVFDNLLPDSEPILKRVAERVGADGTDAYSMLAAIGRDCVGALQFLPEDDVRDALDDKEDAAIHGEVVDEAAIARMIDNLKRAPLGVGADVDEDFRISVAGAQEKTALLRYEEKWLRPHGRTPTTHILKPQIGTIQTAGGDIDLSNSVENEHYCLRLLARFGLDVNATEIRKFGDRKVLVVERFDRRWRDGRLIRLPQEDCCQALSVPPTRKYQNQGGPGVAAIAELLAGSDDPSADQLAFLKSQILFWLIGATDGHAKNFSIFLTPGGRFRLTPFYDVLTAQPGVDDRQIPHKAFRLAMSVGDSGKYRINDISGRHFVQIGRKARLPQSLVRKGMDEVLDAAGSALDGIASDLPANFPEQIHASVSAAVQARLRLLEAGKNEPWRG